MKNLEPAIKMINKGDHESAIDHLKTVARDKASLTTKLLSNILLAKLLKFRRDYPALSKTYTFLIEYMPSSKLYLSAGDNYILCKSLADSKKMYLSSFSLASSPDEKIVCLISLCINSYLSGDLRSAKSYMSRASKISSSKSRSFLCKRILLWLSPDSGLSPGYRGKLTGLIRI